MIDLRQVQAFVAVVESGSFTSAARRLHIGQSGLSAQVKKLESTVGGRLFDRSSRHVEVTPLGRDLFVHAQNLLASAERFAHAAVAPPPKRSLTLAIAENGVNELVLTMLGQIREREPDIDLEVRPVSIRDQHVALADGVDALLGRPPYAGALPDGVERTELATDPLEFVVHRADPMAGRTSVSVDEVLASRRVAPLWLPAVWAVEHPAFTIPQPEQRAAVGADATSFREAAAVVSIQRIGCVMPASFARTYNIPDTIALEIDAAAPMVLELVAHPVDDPDLPESITALMGLDADRIRQEEPV